MAAVVNQDALASQALSFSLAARETEAMEELASAVNEMILPLGLTAAASGMVSGPRAHTPYPFHFQNWPQAWLARYRAEGFMLVDPVPRWALNSGVAITWSALADLLPPRDPGRRVIEAAVGYGFTEGMAVPMRAGDNSLGLVSFGGEREPLSPAEQEFLITIGRAAFNAAERILHQGDVGRPAPIMSAREMECMLLITRGHSNRQIAKMLGLSEPTVRFHVSNARDKSGAVSRTHLAAIAVAQGYVSL